MDEFHQGNRLFAAGILLPFMQAQSLTETQRTYAKLCFAQLFEPCVTFLKFLTALRHLRVRQER